MTRKRSGTPYAKRRNKRRATLLQARKVLRPDEFDALRRAVERHQARDYRNSIGDKFHDPQPLL